MATSKKVGSARDVFRGEMDPGCCGTEGGVVSEKGEREREAYSEMHKNISL